MKKKPNANLAIRGTEMSAERHASQTVSFETYIFDRDEVGMTFAHALGEATRRGVEVRVLIDATGTGIPGPPLSTRCGERG